MKSQRGLPTLSFPFAFRLEAFGFVAADRQPAAAAAKQPRRPNLLKGPWPPKCAPALAKGAQVMFHPRPLLELSSLCCVFRRAPPAAAKQPRRPNLLKGPWPPKRAPALAKGAQVMFHPRPLLELSSLRCVFQRARPAAAKQPRRPNLLCELLSWLRRRCGH